MLLGGQGRSQDPGECTITSPGLPVRPDPEDRLQGLETDYISAYIKDLIHRLLSSLQASLTSNLKGLSATGSSEGS